MQLSKVGSVYSSASKWPGQSTADGLRRRRQNKKIRCRASGNSGQNSFNLLHWGANVIKRLRAPGWGQPEAGKVAVLEDVGEPRAVSANSSSEDPEPSTSGRLPIEASQEEVEASLAERRRAYHHLRREREITEEWPPEGTPTWEDWLEAFQHSDICDQRAADLEREIAIAAEQEDYETAAVLKEQLTEIMQSDEVELIMQRYKEAVRTENFEEAARITEEGSVGLLGWWWPQHSNGGASSHLLRVVRAYDRYMFLAYHAQDIAALHGLVEEREGVPKESQYNPRPDRSAYNQAGMPLMELFYRRYWAAGVDEQPEEGTKEARELPLMSQACAFVDAEDSDSDSDSDSEGSSDESEEHGEEQSLISPVDPAGLATFLQDDSSLQLDRKMIEELSQHEATDTVEIPDFLPMPGQAIQRVPATIMKFDNDRDRFLVSVMPSEEQEAAAREAAAKPAEEEAAPGQAVEVSPPGGGARAVVLKGHRNAKSIRVELRPGMDKSKVNLQQLADQILGQGGVSVSRDGVLSRDGKGRLLQLLVEALEHAEANGSSSGSSEQEQQYGLQGLISYKRIPLDQPRTDPFTGIFIGIFSGNGPEVLQLQRAYGEDGREYVEGTKLTGDESAPAGNVAFRAAIGIKQRLPVHSHYPPELDITARYKGQGRMGRPGSKDTRWVDGELLQFGGYEDGVAKGAELGFLWNVSGDNKFLSLLQRVTLDDPSLDDKEGQ